MRTTRLCDMEALHQTYQAEGLFATLNPDFPTILRLSGSTWDSYVELSPLFNAERHEAFRWAVGQLIRDIRCPFAHVGERHITLVWPAHVEWAQLPYKGREQELLTAAVSIVTRNLVKSLARLPDGLQGPLPYFTGNVWQVPCLNLTADYILARERKTAVNAFNKLVGQTLGQASDNHSTAARKQLLHDRGVSFCTLPRHVRQGYFVRPESPEAVSVARAKILEEHPELADEIATIRPRQVEWLDIPAFQHVENKLAVMFGCAPPVLCSRAENLYLEIEGQDAIWATRLIPESA